MVWKTNIVLCLALYVLGEIKATRTDKNVELHITGDHGRVPHISHQKPEHHEVYVQAHPSYEFSYKVDDSNTHDIKEQHEVRNGDEVHGNYWFIQPDGERRHVKYHVDDKSGFTALVDYTSPHSNVYNNQILDEGISKSHNIIRSEDNNIKSSQRYRNQQKEQNLKIDNQREGIQEGGNAKEKHELSVQDNEYRIKYRKQYDDNSNYQSKKGQLNKDYQTEYNIEDYKWHNFGQEEHIKNEALRESIEKENKRQNVRKGENQSKVCYESDDRKDKKVKVKLFNSKNNGYVSLRSSTENDSTNRKGNSEDNKIRVDPFNTRNYHSEAVQENEWKENTINKQNKTREEKRYPERPNNDGTNRHSDKRHQYQDWLKPEIKHNTDRQEKHFWPKLAQRNSEQNENDMQVSKQNNWPKKQQPRDNENSKVEISRNDYRKNSLDMKSFDERLEAKEEVRSEPKGGYGIVHYHQHLRPHIYEWKENIFLNRSEDDEKIIPDYSPYNNINHDHEYKNTAKTQENYHSRGQNRKTEKGNGSGQEKLGENKRWVGRKNDGWIYINDSLENKELPTENDEKEERVKENVDDGTDLGLYIHDKATLRYQAYMH